MSSCSFTGHRPQHLPYQYQENHPERRKLKVHLYNIIGTLAKDGITDFYTGMALGTDTYCSEIVLFLKEKYFPHIKLHAVLPCEHQEKKWREHDRMKYTDILSKCTSHYYISIEYNSKCMFQRNDYLIEKADILLAIYDGFSKGGTSYTLEKAKHQQKKIILVNPHNFTI